MIQYFILLSGVVATMVYYMSRQQEHIAELEHIMVLADNEHVQRENEMRALLNELTDAVNMLMEDHV